MPREARLPIAIVVNDDDGHGMLRFAGRARLWARSA
jgi:hypothetical protein